MCVLCDILSPTAVYRVLCPFFRPKMFSPPVTVYGTTHAHLVHMYWPLLWGLHQMGRSFATFGTYALVGSLQWIMRVLNGIPLQSPAPPGGRLSRARGGYFKGGGGTKIYLQCNTSGWFSCTILEPARVL